MTTTEIEIIHLSLKVALCSTLCLIPLGIAGGWLLARKEFPGKALLEGLMYLPLTMPPVVTGYTLLVILGARGTVGRWLDAWFGIRLAFTWQGAVLASMIMAYPLMTRSIRLAFEQVDTGLEDAAKTLGIGRLQTFRRVTLPLAWPGVLAGVILAFARSLGEFGATITFVGNISGETRTLPLAIHSALQMPGGEINVLRLVLPAALLSLVAIAIAETMARRSQAFRREA